MKKPTNTEMIEALSVAVKELQKELRLVKLKLKKYENKTIGGFNSYLSPRDIGIEDETNY